MRYVVRGGQAWRVMPNDLPPWSIVYQQAQRWIAASVFEAMTQDLRRILRLLGGRREEPSASIFDSCTLQSTPESGGRAGYDGAKRRKGSKVHMAVDTLGHLLALHVTAADEQDRAQVGRLARDVQEQTGKSVELVYVDQGDALVCSSVSRLGPPLRDSTNHWGSGTQLMPAKPWRGYAYRSWRAVTSPKS